LISKRRLVQLMQAAPLAIRKNLDLGVMVIFLVTYLASTAASLVPLVLITGLPLLFFFPGYLLSKAFLEVKDLVQSIIYSLGLSVALFILYGTVMAFMGIFESDALLVIAVVVLAILSIIVLLQRMEKVKAPSSFEVGGWDRRLLAVVIVFLVASSALVYGFSVKREDNAYTEFYITDASGELDGIASSINTNETMYVLFHISNHENEAVQYTVLLWTGNGTGPQLDMLGDSLALDLASSQTFAKEIEVANGEAYEGHLQLYSNTTGDYRINLLLQKNGKATDQELLLHIDVI